MNKLLLATVAVGATVAATAASAQDEKTLGIVALLANDALNIAVINGATEVAEANGWTVNVIDTQASADQANAAMNTFVAQGVDAIFTLAYASTSLGSGIAAAREAEIPVAAWGGEIVDGIVVTTSGQQVGDDSVNYLLEVVGDTANILALTFHPGKLCIDRGVGFDEGIAGMEGIDVEYAEVVVPGQVQFGNATAAAWLTAHPGTDGVPLAIWSCWDEPTTGAVAALRQAGRTDVTTVSINGSLQALDLVKNGYMTATVWQPAHEEGKQVMEAILEAIEAGDAWEPKVISIPGVVVTQDNVEQFLAEHPDGM